MEAAVLLEQDSAYDFGALVYVTISGQHVEAALEQFREAVTAKKHINNGSHFNMHYLINAHEACVTHVDALTNSPNRDLFWCKVISFVQRSNSVNQVA